MKVKKWYESKQVWLGIIITAQGFVPLVIDLLEKQSVLPSDVAVAVSGALAVILRVWFTEGRVEKSLV
jgi:hypothetical protein